MNNRPGQADIIDVSLGGDANSWVETTPSGVDIATPSQKLRLSESQGLVYNGIPLAGGAVYSTVLAADAATIDTGANAIPATGNILNVYALLRTDESAAFSTVMVRFNGDTGTNYDVSSAQVSNTTITGAANLALTGVDLAVAAGSNTAAVASPMTCSIPGYALTTFNKTGVSTQSLADQTAANMRIRLKGFEWRNTAAINQVTLAITTGSSQKFKAGSALWVYIQ